MHLLALSDETAIVMMSSNDHVSIVEACVVQGADSYILKPPRRQELEALWDVGQLLDDVDMAA